MEKGKKTILMELPRRCNNRRRQSRAKRPTLTLQSIYPNAFLKLRMTIQKDSNFQIKALFNAIHIS